MRRMVATATAAALAATFVASCGDADSAPLATTTAPPTSTGGTTTTTTTLPTEAALANADGEIATALGTFPLQVDQCSLDAGGPVLVVAETDDGAGRLDLGGTAGAATIVFTLDHGDGEPVVWTAAPAAPEIDGALLTYEGPSLVSGRAVPDTGITLTLSC